MEARLNLSASPFAAKSMKYMASASKVVIEDSTLPKSTQDICGSSSSMAGWVPSAARTARWIWCGSR